MCRKSQLGEVVTQIDFEMEGSEYSASGLMLLGNLISIAYSHFWCDRKPRHS